ncbi:MAG: DNA/RNA non-specific endonuclease [Actinomycetota bacterium]
MARKVKGIAIATLALFAVGCTPQMPSQAPSSPPPQVTPAKPKAQKPTAQKPIAQKPVAQSPTANNPNLLTGNPSNATASTANADNYLMVKPQYALSYNNSKGTANWVSWQSNKSWIATLDRSNDFRPDTSLPAGFYQVRPNDYTNTGYDRGHIIPSGDRTASKADNSATFLMTNMLPQVPELNREVWREFEEHCRQLVSQGKELYIIAGPYGKKGAIANGKVTVPTDNWKVVLVLDKPGSGLQGVTAQTQTIAVWMPNDKTIANTDWKRYIVTVDDVQKKTGYDFFSNVPVTVQKVIESKRYNP